MSRVLARLSLCLLSCQMFFCRVSPAHAETSLDAMLEPYLARYDLPALAAAVTINGKMVAVGAVGTRKAGTDMPVKIGDRFHLGSDTKAMTALLAAIFVEAGKLRWDSTIAEVFPELTDQMVPSLRGVALQQLLSLRWIPNVRPEL